MKKTLLTLSLIGLLALPMIGLAQDPTPAFATDITGILGVLGVIDTITNWIFWILLAVAVIFVVMAAFQFVTSGGNPEAVSQARTKILYAVVGVAIAFLAKAIVWIATSLVT